MTESDEIEEILYEAHGLGIKDLVMEEAKNIYFNNNRIRRSDAYRRALEYLKKNSTKIGDINQSEK